MKGLAPRVEEAVLTMLSLLLTAAALGWMVRFCGYGFEFSDEGYLLNWIASPFSYRYSTTHFGFLFHPLYALVGGDIAALRRMNLAITFGGSTVLVYLFLQNELRRKAANTMFGWDRLRLLILALAFSIAATYSLAHFTQWYPTPGYNNLNLMSIIVTYIGLMLLGRDAAQSHWGGWLLLGVGGYLGLMAKPTTAAVLGLLVLPSLILSHRPPVRGMLLAFITFLVLLIFSAWYIEGSLIGFFKRILTGNRALRMVNTTHTLWHALRIDTFPFTARQKGSFSLIALTTFAVILLSGLRRKRVGFIGLLVAISATLTGLCVILGMKTIPLSGYYTGVYFLGIPLGILAASLLLKPAELFQSLSKPQGALAFAFLVLPHVFAFGTDNNYWNAAPQAGIFWILFGLVFLIPRLDRSNFFRAMFPVAFLVQLLTILLVHTGLEHPYRQPEPMRMAGEKIPVSDKGKLFVSQNYATYIEGLRNMAAQAGFQPDTPLMDLTGHSPGMVYLLKAKALGRPWLRGGSPGSLDAAKFALDFVDGSEMARAWILDEPEGPNRIDPSLLEHYGLDLKRDYLLVGTIVTPPGKGGYRDSYRQRLYKPKKGPSPFGVEKGSPSS